MERMTVERAEALAAEFNAMSEAQYKKLAALPNARNILDELFTARALTDFWVHLWHVVYRNARQHYCNLVHREMAHWLMDWTILEHGERVPVNTKVDSVFREGRKSQLVTIAYNSWEIARDWDHRIMIRSFKDPEAIKSVSMTKELILSENYQNRYPWIQPAMDKSQRVKWEASAFRVKRGIQGVKTHTMEAFGVKTDPTGNHFTRLHYDDWETKEVQYSDTYQRLIVDTFLSDTNLMIAGGRTIITGTPWCQKLFIDAALKGIYPFEDRRYSVFRLPAEVKVFDHAFRGQEPILLDDRQTVRCESACFPTQEGNLKYHQAKLSFYSEAIKDVTNVYREIEWNDGTHFRVNRPFPVELGQPITYEVSTTRIAMPHIHTYDEAEQTTEYQGVTIARKSLREEKQKQGTAYYSSQILLNPIDAEAAVFSREQFKIISRDQLPEEGARNWYRTVDLASSRKTKCRSAISTGFLHQTGLYICHGVVGNWRTMDLLLELILGIERVRDWGGELKWTAFEQQGREEFLGEDLRLAAKNPYGYFHLSGGKYAEYAEQYFHPEKPVHIKEFFVKRPPNVAKPQRIMSLQPMVEQGRVYIVEDVPYIEDLLDEADTFTMDSQVGFDIFDTLADIVREGRIPSKPKERDNRTHDFLREQQQAMRRLYGRALVKTGTMG